VALQLSSFATKSTHFQKPKTFTGINGVNTQDYDLQEGMGGPIVDQVQGAF